MKRKLSAIILSAVMMVTTVGSAMGMTLYGYYTWNNKFNPLGEHFGKSGISAWASESSEDYCGAATRMVRGKTDTGYTYAYNGAFATTELSAYTTKSTTKYYGYILK